MPDIMPKEWEDDVVRRLRGLAPRAEAVKAIDTILAELDKYEPKLVRQCVARRRPYRPIRRLLGLPLAFLPIGAVYYLCLVARSGIPAVAFTCGLIAVFGLYLVMDR